LKLFLMITSNKNSAPVKIYHHSFFKHVNRTIPYNIIFIFHFWIKFFRSRKKEIYQT
jgi:hypothetical protein